jgi:hypothetical protein
MYISICIFIYMYKATGNGVLEYSNGDYYDGKGYSCFCMLMIYMFLYV